MQEEYGGVESEWCKENLMGYWAIVVGLRMKRMKRKCELRLDSPEYRKEGGL